MDLSVEQPGSFGLLQFYGAGLSFNPIGIVKADSRHIVKIAGGLGYVHGYTGQAYAKGELTHWSNSGMGYFATVAYRYRLTNLFSLGAYAGYLYTHASQTHAGISLGFEIP